MDYTLYSGSHGCIHEVAGVAHSGVVVDGAAGEAYPVGVEEGVGSAQAVGQLLRVVEVQGTALYPVAEGTGGSRVSGEGAHRGAVVQQALGNVAASVAEGAGYYGEAGFMQWVASLTIFQGRTHTVASGDKALAPRFRGNDEYGRE